MGESPKNWLLIDQYDGNYIFENGDNSFCVNIDYTSGCNYPYSINMRQMKGDLVEIGIEKGAYSTHANTLLEALPKAYVLMSFINSRMGTNQFEEKSRRN